VNQVVRIHSAFCSAEIIPLGAMLGPVEFDLGGKRVRPLAIAPWADDAPSALATIPPILRSLRGEWPCVPFGSDEPPPGLPDAWRDSAGKRPDWHQDSHGFGANHEWSLVEQSEHAAVLAIDYPSTHPIARLTRHVSCDLGAPRLRLRLIVEAREDVAMPIGLHPVFRLPANAGGARLVLPPQTRCWSFPVEVEPGKTAAQPDQRDVAPEHLLDRDGAPLNFRDLPLAEDSEDLLLLTKTGGQITLENHAEGYAAGLNWDAGALPSCSLWLSNRGRGFYPWNSRFTAIGIEPVAASFDLGPSWAEGDNPLHRAGVPTSVRLRRGQPWSIEYSIGCQAL
jgi:hypothetical protein